jgi:hypothetical protein
MVKVGQIVALIRDTWDNDGNTLMPTGLHVVVLDINEDNGNLLVEGEDDNEQPCEAIIHREDWRGING